LLNLYERNDFNLLVIVIIQTNFASSPGKRYTNGASITAMKSGVLFLFMLRVASGASASYNENHYAEGGGRSWHDDSSSHNFIITRSVSTP
jgi:hypothetical protein